MPPEEIRIRTGRLHGGISQQPEHVRFSNQVTTADNATASVVDGMRRRTGTRFVRSVSGLIEGGNYRLHPIDRDQNEKFLVIYGEGDIRVFDILGNQALVSITPEAQAYLSANSPSADQLRFKTILDSTFIVNTTVPVSTDSTVVNFSVTETWEDYDILASQLPEEDGEFHRALAPGEVRPEGYYRYDVAGENGFAVWTRGPIHNIAWDNPAFWSNPSDNPLGVKIRFQRTAIGVNNVNYTANDADEGGVPTIGDAGNQFFAYEFQNGDEIHITATGNATDLPKGFYPIVAKLSNGKIQIDRDGARDTIGGGQTEVPIHASDTNDVTGVSASGITRAYVAKVDFRASPQPTMQKVALKLQNAIRADAGSDIGGSDIIIQYLQTGRFRVVSPWRGVNSKIVQFYRTLDSGTNSKAADQGGDPFWFGNGTAVEGTGTPAERTQFVDARWVQVPAPGSATSTPDPTTLPVKMARTSLSPLKFDIDVINWNNRLSGDDESNPVPELFEKNAPVADITLWHDRLWLFGDTFAAASRAGDIFNFYREDATNASDDDPIDLRLSNDRVTVVDFVAQFREAIEVFTKAGQQYRSNNPDTVSPTSIVFTPSSTYTTLPVRPTVSSQRLYFLGTGNQGAKMFESFFDDVTVTTEAAEITRHVPELLPITMRTIQTHTNENMVFALPKDDNKIFVYTSHWENGQKVQSAWTRWVYDQSYRIADLAIINDDGYILVESEASETDRYVIERFRVSGGGENTFDEFAEPMAATANIGVFGTPVVDPEWVWATGSDTDEIRAFLESTFNVNWTVLPDPITPESLQGLDVVILTTNSGAAGFAGASDPIGTSEQQALSNFIKAGGNYIIVGESIASTGSPPTPPTLDALLLMDLTGNDRLSFTFNGLTSGGTTGLTTTLDDTLTIINGPIGLVTELRYSNPSTIDTGDPRAIQTGFRPSTSNLAAGNIIAYFPPGAYSPGSGAIMLVTDSQMFWDSDISTSQIDDNSKILLGNFIAAKVGTEGQTEVIGTIINKDPVFMDRTFVAVGTLNGSDTEWTLPIENPLVDTIVLGPDFGDDEVKAIPISSTTGNVVTVSGMDLTAGPVLIGRQFTTTIEPTKPFVRDGNGFALRNVWLQYREVIVEHHDTTGYTVKSAMPNRPDRMREFSSPVETTGELTANLNGQVKKSDITINSVGVKPMTITGIEYELDFIPRTG